MQFPLELWGRAAQMCPLHQQSPITFSLVWALLSCFMHFISPTGTNNTQLILIGFTQRLSRFYHVFSRLKSPSLFSSSPTPIAFESFLVPLHSFWDKKMRNAYSIKDRNEPRLFSALFFNPFLAIPNILIGFLLKNKTKQKFGYDLKDLSKVQVLSPGGKS